MSNTYYSENGEEYRHDELGEAICMVLDDCSELEVGSEFSVHEGECNFRKASSYAQDVFEEMQNQAYDELPDFADSWPNVTSEQQRELTEGINQLIDSWG